MDTVIAAFQLIFTPYIFLIIFAGVMFGMIVGAMPGLGSVLAITIMLPFTFSMGQIPSIALLLAIYCASVYGGSLSAILINTPGTPQSAATVLDGFPLTMQGKADYAIGWATISSVIGGIFSVIVLIFAAPQLAQFALRFGPVETFSLICMALTCIAGVSKGSLLKGLFAGIIGLFLSTVGIDQMSGMTRFDYGVFELTAGLQLIPILVGMFALSEVFNRISDKKWGEPSSIFSSISPRGFKVAPISEWASRWRTIIKSSVIGTLIGILPGTGAATASFISYAEAKRSGKYRDNFGKGEPEGIIASEASNNAVTGGALVPTLALGIPGDPVTAIMMSALIMQGVQPGVRLFIDNAELMYGAFIALIIANIFILIAGFISTRAIIRVLRIPEPILLVMVLILSMVGSYGVNGRMFDVLVTLGAGIFGLIFRRYGVPIAPIIIGLVLGPIFEESLRQGMILNDNNFATFFSFEYPIALSLFIVTFLILAMSLTRGIKETLTRRVINLAGK